MFLITALSCTSVYCSKEKQPWKLWVQIKEKNFSIIPGRWRFCIPLSSLFVLSEEVKSHFESHWKFPLELLSRSQCRLQKLQGKCVKNLMTKQWPCHENTVLCKTTWIIHITSENKCLISQVYYVKLELLSS